MCLIGLLFGLWSNFRTPISSSHEKFHVEIVFGTITKTTLTPPTTTTTAAATTTPPPPPPTTTTTTTTTRPSYSPQRPDGRTLGFLQDLCQIDDYPGMAPSCFYSPRDLMPSLKELMLNMTTNTTTNMEFVQYLDPSCNDDDDLEGEGKFRKCSPPLTIAPLTQTFALCSHGLKPLF